MSQHVSTQEIDEDVFDSEMEDFDQFYDHERLAINRVWNQIVQNSGTSRELGGFQREVRERFAEIGFVVRCDLYTNLADDHMAPEDRPRYPKISFTGRCEPMKVGEFDHEKMGHEVRSNVLGKKGQENVQKTQIAPGFASTKSGLIIPGS